MKITYLGHAGFLVETAQAIIVMDAWLSPQGAFDAAWFQFPCNHHLLPLVQKKLRQKDKEKYIYVSHEHKDHFCQWTLEQIGSEDFTFVIPKFRRPVLVDLIRKISHKNILLSEDNRRIEIPGGYLKIYAEDSELNRDSGILVSADGQRFLNINDCKIHDRLPRIRMDEGEINAFAAQYSGATWHPVCYDYDKADYERISRKKMYSKFEATARAIEAVSPQFYLPSAGPPCFLDPQLFSINFEPTNIFPRTAKLFDYFEKRLQKIAVNTPDWMPGDVLDIEANTWDTAANIRINNDNFKPYLEEYAERYVDYFAKRKKTFAKHKNTEIQARLIDNLNEKLAHFTLATQIDRPLYFVFSDAPNVITKVDFQRQKATCATEITDGDFYRLTVPAYEIARVLDGYLTWEDFSLTFRMRLNRKPDVYQTIMQGFLILEAADLAAFCGHILALENRAERIVVEAGGCRYSVDKWCPHQGADMSQAWVEDGRYLVCPRHRWRFDLQQDGDCVDNAGTINCIALEEE